MDNTLGLVIAMLRRKVRGVERAIRVIGQKTVVDDIDMAAKASVRHIVELESDVARLQAELTRTLTRLATMRDEVQAATNCALTKGEINEGS